MEKSKAIIVSSVGFAPLMELWVSLMSPIPQEIQVYIVVKDVINQTDWDEVVRTLPENFHVIVSENLYPQSLQETINAVPEEVLLLMHDDTIVFDLGMALLPLKLAELGYFVTPLQCTYSPIKEVQEFLDLTFPDGPFKTPSGKQEYSFLLNFACGPRHLFSDVDVWRPRDNPSMGADIGFNVLIKILEGRVPLIALDHVSVGAGVHDEEPVQKLAKGIKDLGWFHVETLGYLIKNIFDGEERWKGEVLGDMGKRGLEARMGFLKLLVKPGSDYDLKLDEVINHYELNLSNINEYKTVFYEGSRL